MPALFAVHLGSGLAGGTAATITGSLSVDTSLPTNANGDTLVEAGSIQEAVGLALTGTINGPVRRADLDLLDGRRHGRCELRRAEAVFGDGRRLDPVRRHGRRRGQRLGLQRLFLGRDRQGRHRPSGATGSAIASESAVSSQSAIPTRATGSAADDHDQPDHQPDRRGQRLLFDPSQQEYRRFNRDLLHAHRHCNGGRGLHQL